MFNPAQTVVIANPAAAGGRVGQQWEAYSARIRAQLGEVRLVRTERSGHGIELAAQAVRDGATELLSLGGDGTHNEVVNGIMAAAPPKGAVTLGILPAGTGGDFRRNLAHAATLDDALQHLVAADCHPIDLGRCHYADDQGQPGSRWFVNIASCGISGLVCRIANASSKRLPGKATFFLSTLRAMARYQGSPVRVTVDGVVVGEHRITSLQACNGRYAGGGMMFAPQACLDDGLLDVVIMEERGFLRTVSKSGLLYEGQHLALPEVHFHQGRVIEVEPLDPALPSWVDIDGEAPGKAPVRFEIVPGAIQLRGALPGLVGAAGS